LRLLRRATEENVACASGISLGRCGGRVVGSWQSAQGSKPDIGHFDPVLRTVVTVLKGVRLIKTGAHGSHIYGTIGHRNCEDVFLAVVAKVDGAFEPNIVGCYPFRNQIVAPPFGESGERRLQRVQRHKIPKAVERLFEVVAHVRLQHAPGGESAGMDRNDHFANLQLLGQRGSLRRPGTPECHQRELAGVNAAPHRDRADRVRHFGVDDVDHTLGHRLGAHAELLSHLGKSAERRVSVQSHVGTGEIRAV